MWSKRRKRIARLYDWKGHKYYLIRKIVFDAMYGRIVKELDKAILYGMEEYSKREPGFPIITAIVDAMISARGLNYD